MTTEQLAPAPAPVDESSHPSRRRLLIGSAAVATSVVAGEVLTAGAALGAPSYTVRPYRKTAIPSRAQLHMMNRMGCGYSRTTWTQMKRAGGATKWFNKQLNYTRVAENKKTKSLLDWFPDLRESAPRKWQRQQMKSKAAWEYAVDLANYTMLRRMYSNRQVHETMVDFWSNHLHVHAAGDLKWVHRFSYDTMIRKHALGRFDQMLVAATLHPAMLLYLDNWRSIKNAPNENHGRELLELHTVGRTSGYTEDMVKDSAKVLSGYTVDAFETWRAFYDPKKHTTGAVQVLGFGNANRSEDGSQLTRDYLRYLAHHPATARTIARKLALRFVSDSPSNALVDHLASVFQRSGTDIKATLKALVAHKEFKASAGDKVRTPIEDLVATVRVLQVSAQKPTGAKAFARTISWLHQNMVLYHWPRPDGTPDRNSAWSTATRMMSSFRMHWNLGGGWYPDVNVRYRSPASWLPERRIRLDQYVDHLCRMLHGKGSSPRILEAAVQAVGYPPGEIITKDHAVGGWLFVRLLGVLLDSPDHMSR